MTRRFLHNTPWSSLLDAWSEVHPRLRYTIHVRDDRPPSKQAARSAPPNSAVASAACLEARPGPVTPSTRNSGLAVHIGREPTLEAGLDRRNRNRRFARDGNRFAAGGADPQGGHAGALHFRQHQAGLLRRDSHDITRLVLA